MANIILRWLHFAIFLITLIFIDVAYSTDVNIKGLNLIDTEPHRLRSSLEGLKRDVRVEAKRVGYRNGQFPPPKQSPKISFKMSETWKLPSLKTAVKTGLKVGKTNVYAFLGTAALGYILKKTGWFEDNNQLVYVPADYEFYEFAQLNDRYFASKTDYDTNPDSFLKFKNDVEACMYDAQFNNVDISPLIPYSPLADYSDPNFLSGTAWCRWHDYGESNVIYKQHIVWALNGTCPATYSSHPEFGTCARKKSDQPVTRLVTDDMIDDLDLSDYEPHQSDIPLLSPHLGVPDEVTITEQPKPIVLPREITTTQNPDGSTTTTAKDTTINLTINTTNHGDMYVTTTETTTTTTYQDGTQTSKTTETKTIDNKDSTLKTENDDTKQDIKVEFPDIPTDCDLVPSLCDTQKKIIDQDKNFYEWMREPFDGLNEPELPRAKDKDFTRKYPINIAEVQCPNPMELNTILAGTVSVSFEPFCQFAAIVRYLVLTGASIFAAYILLGVVRHG